MNYFLIAYNPSIEWRHVTHCEIGEFDDLPLLFAEKLESSPDLSLKLFVSDSGKWPDMMNNPKSWYLVSNKTKSIFKKYCNQCIFHPINDNIMSNNETHLNYWLMSFYYKLYCMDKSNSIYRERHGFTTITKLILDRTKIPKDAHVFLVGESVSWLIIDDLFKSELINAGVQDLEYIDFESE